MDRKYNGWTNYETWAVALWMDNEQGTQEYWHDAARDALESTGNRSYNVWTPAEAASHTLANVLKEEYAEAMPQVEGVYADLLNAALSEVNWTEIAANLITAVTEEA